MKRSAAVILAGVLLCLSACGAPAATEQTAEDAAHTAAEPTAFRLDALPDIGTRKPGAVNGRFFPEYRDTFEPRDDYGSLVPFIGSVFYYTTNPYPGEDEEDSENAYTPPQYRYGLMTGDGRIVVDDVFVEVYFVDEAGPCGAYCAEPFADRGAKSMHREDIDTDEEYEWLYQNMPQEADKWYISADGTWSYRMPYNRWCSFGETLFADCPSGMYETAPEENKVKVYDYQGRLRFEIPGDPDGKGRTPGGMMAMWLPGDVLMLQIWFPEANGYEYYFRDKTGKPMLEELKTVDHCDAFGAYLIIEQQEDQFRLLDLRGTQKAESAYMRVETPGDTSYLVMEQDGEYRILDKDLRQIGDPKSFLPYLKTLDGQIVYSDSVYYYTGECWFLGTDEPAEWTKESDFTDYIDGRYIGKRNQKHDVTLHDTKTGKDLVTVKNADASTVFANGELLFFYGLYGEKTHEDHVYSLREQKMLLEKESISWFECMDSVFLVCCDGGLSTVLNYTTGEKIYNKTVE